MAASFRSFLTIFFVRLQMACNCYVLGRIGQRLYYCPKCSVLLPVGEIYTSTLLYVAVVIRLVAREM